MKICPECKRTSCVDADKFCYHDGTVLKDYEQCRCGREINKEFDKYCPQCGRKLYEDLVTKFIRTVGGPSSDLDSDN